MKRKGARDSQIINNFFSLATIVIVTSVLIVYVKYIAPSTEENKNNEITELACQDNIYYYSKVFNQNLLNKAVIALQKAYYKLDGSYIQSVNKKSSIEHIVSISELSKMYENAIGLKAKKNIIKLLKIDYIIIENDKKSSHKNYKMKAGSIMTSFKANDIEIFKFYIDIKFLYKEEIKNKIKCTIEVFKHHAKK